MGCGASKGQDVQKPAGSSVASKGQDVQKPAGKCLNDLEEFQSMDVVGNGFIDFPLFLTARVRAKGLSVEKLTDSNIQDMKKEFDAWDTSGTGQFNYEAYLAGKQRGLSILSSVAESKNPYRDISGLSIESANAVEALVPPGVGNNQVGQAAASDTDMVTEFRSIDADGNGFIDFPEFLMARVRAKGVSVEGLSDSNIDDMKKEFGAWDTSGKGMFDFETYVLGRQKGRTILSVSPVDDNEDNPNLAESNVVQGTLVQKPLF